MMAGQLPALEERIRSRIEAPDPAFWNRCIEIGTALRDRFQEKGNCNLANRAWFLRAVAESRSLMIQAINEIQGGRHKDGWCTLEHAELSCRALRRNAFLDPDGYGVTTLLTQVERWQSLFPYKVFGSPEFVIEAARCSICQTVSSPWSGCEHVPNIVYCGEMCHRTIEGMSLKSVSIVLEPVQKFSVLIAYGEDGSDPMDYSMVNWVAERIASPFDQWNVEWTTEIHPHHLFSAAPGDPCPCGSGKYYRCCCLYTLGVRRPHAQFSFPTAPSQELSDFDYVGYDDVRHLGPSLTEKSTTFTGSLLPD
jgi:hypothetical protein